MHSFKIHIWFWPLQLGHAHNHDVPIFGNRTFDRIDKEIGSIEASVFSDLSWQTGGLALHGWWTGDAHTLHFDWIFAIFFKKKYTLGWISCCGQNVHCLARKIWHRWAMLVGCVEWGSLKDFYWGAGEWFKTVAALYVIVMWPFHTKTNFGSMEF